MPKPFLKITLPDFQHLVQAFGWERDITEIHMHHTWSPRHADYEGEATINAMWRYHTVEKGWSDIAQHLSIGPGGEIWTGRGWDNPPASSTGHNGTTARGPFMFEIIGNFDEGEDLFEGTQKAAVMGITLALLDQFNLPVSALRFHHQLGSPKSCPGTGIDYGVFCDELEVKQTAGKQAAKAKGIAPPPALPALPAKLLQAVGDLLPNIHEERGACPHCEAETRETAGNTRGLFGPTWSAAQKALLARHVINLRDGRFIESGDYTTSLEQVEHLFQHILPEALDKARQAKRPLRVLFWAHGGLVGEKDALKHVLENAPLWETAGIYPIYFIWETGLFNALRDIFRGRPQERGFADITDKLLEEALHVPGTRVWSQMKEYALHASASQGGARLTAELLAVFAGEARDAGTAVEYYACGHSAGAIFHSYFLPVVSQLGGPGFHQLFLLAPAITVEAFKERLLPLTAADASVDGVTMFTMTDAAEREDSLIELYKKSLLYFVSRACEPARPEPLLGLDLSVREDFSIRQFFGLDGGDAPGGIVFSPNGQHSGNSASNSRQHGDFDNDPDTMNSVARRITRDPGISPFPATAPPQRGLPAAIGRKRALCVGINDYPAAPLSGCVNDARKWQDVLTTLGYEVTMLTDTQATRAGLIAALGKLIDSSVDGDSLVFQYSGHGTYVDDVSGDEKDQIGENGKPNTGDVHDEALVPHDYATGEFLIDDDLGALFERVPAGARLTCFMDCCHSGTNVRALFPTPGASARADGGRERERFLRVPADIMARHIAVRKQEISRGAFRSEDSKNKAPVISFAACLDKQTAKEIDGHGYFTKAACTLLADAAGKVTHQDFMRAVIKGFPLPSESQLPYLFCGTDFRSEILLAPPSPVRATAPAAELAATTTAPAGSKEPARNGSAVQPQDLVETMRDYMQILKKLV